MKKIKIIGLLLLFVGSTFSCKDQLDIVNPNEPTTATLNSEKGIVKFALSGIYVNGFVAIKYSDGVLGLFWGNGMFDMMADVVGAEAANVFINQISSAESVKLDNGSVVPNPNSPKHQPDMLRQNNVNGLLGQNPIFAEWGHMYSLNRSCNFILGNVDAINFSGNADVKKNTLKAWAYWWKGFAYSRLGSLYYAGLVVDSFDGKTNGDYKLNSEILAEAEKNFAAAENILKALSPDDTYNQLMSQIIPDFNQTGKGGVLTPAQWIKTINTFRARNILANKKVSQMTSTEWDRILTLTNTGVGASDLVFTCRSNSNSDILGTIGGTVAAKSTGDPKAAATYKISERLIQDFQAGDKRLANNFEMLASPWIGNVDRGNIFNTRWALLDGGKQMAGVITYSDRRVGATEMYMAGTYEENELMKAEALIMKGGAANIDAGVALINAVRNYQGAGLAALPNGMSQSAAYAQLRSERRVALLFRSLAFYDARRWGVIDPLSQGGGRTGAVVVDKNGVVNTNAVIDYQYLDYWDVPDNELVYNRPSATSSVVKNPRQ